jgi:hypothetical protein
MSFDFFREKILDIVVPSFSLMIGLSIIQMLLQYAVGFAGEGSSLPLVIKP